MAKDTFGRLQLRLNKVAEELDGLDGEIAKAVADEADHRELSRLRTRRRDLAEEADDISEALRHIEDRAKAAVDEEQQKKVAKACDEARACSSGFIKAAGEVDDALMALEQAFDKLRLSEIDLSRALRRAGQSSNGRLVNGIGPALRWAVWRSAEGFAKMAEVPRAPAHRRRSLADSVKRLVPAIQEG